MEQLVYPPQLLAINSKLLDLFKLVIHHMIYVRMYTYILVSYMVFLMMIEGGYYI